MRASVVIPVWNGASVIEACLHSVFANAEGRLAEVICVDNASPDGAAALIAERFPQARLLRQPVNLGFAGGVNAGLEAATGEALILLNQDCEVHPGWLTAWDQALAAAPGVGVLGATVLNAAGAVDHTGARLDRPRFFGVHLTDAPEAMPPREYVTGAAFLLRRAVWEAVGPFDEGFYPGYFEESDYCFRARRRGWETACALEARVAHRRSSTQWQREPLRTTVIQTRMRYRFVVKHATQAEAEAFFQAERAAAAAEPYLLPVIAQTVAARAALRALPEALARRAADLGAPASPVLARLFQQGLRELARSAAHRASGLAADPGQLATLPGATDPAQEARWATSLADEHALLERLLYAPPAGQPEPAWRSWWRRFVLRPLSALSGRDALLLAELLRRTQTRAAEEHAARRQLEDRERLFDILMEYDDQP